MSEDLFPSKLALGSQFCNRVMERKALADNIAKARHTVLVSPRRYGKSSLAHQVITEMKLPFASIDLFLAHDDKTVTQRLLGGISKAVSEILPSGEKAFKKVQALFSKFRISLGLGLFQIELMQDGGDLDAVDQIYSALTALADLAAQEKKKIIIFIDEFQDISAAKSSKSIQGAIRHVAQETSSLVFLFSGSNRHLLLEMFDDKSMPLYMLCDKLHLERMHSSDYRSHLDALAIKVWGKKLPDAVFNKLMTLTELHPFYVNLLCHKLWKENFPDVAKVESAWHACMEEESRRIRAEIEKLTRNQQDLLKTLALYPTEEPTGQAFSARSGLSASSLHQAFKILSDQDVVFRVKQLDECVPLFQKNQVRVLDPLMAYYFKQFS